MNIDIRNLAGLTKEELNNFANMAGINIAQLCKSAAKKHSEASLFLRRVKDLSEEEEEFLKQTIQCCNSILSTLEYRVSMRSRKVTLTSIREKFATQNDF